MNETTKKQFPNGFYWGAATSAFQVEGNITNMDWEKAAQEGKVPLIGRAADHYCRYEEDFDIVKSLGHNAHRLSIEWARIEPEEGKFDEDEIEHYRKVLQALRARGIEPFVTLWHFTLPLWFSESDGFERKDSPEIFARYCAHVVSKLDDLCTHFSTINEPNVYAGHGWLYGAWPPFKRGKIFHIKLGKGDGTEHEENCSFKNVLTYFRVVQNLINSHNRAYDMIKLLNPSVDIGIVKHVRFFESNWNPFNKVLAKVAAYVQSGYFMNRVYKKCDSIGLNYYRHTKFGDTQVYEKTDMGWSIYPEGIYGALKFLARYKKPLYVTEAGIADAADTKRADYITKQVTGVWRAIQEGVEVRGHMYWSFLDNYELALGFEKRFGLVEIDYKTLERKIRPSAYVYKKICEENAVQ